MHPPPPPGQGIPNGPPGALSADTPGPTTPLPVGQINEQYLQQHQNVSNRLEADRGYDSVFSQAKYVVRTEVVLLSRPMSNSSLHRMLLPLSTTLLYDTTDVAGQVQ
ncbi:MAG: hypothetical protein LQ341_003848 [Variospora aurantia]|nr:MAG: hypothetical protein LQ341_003848 [Variospora aurantia]